MAAKVPTWICPVGSGWIKGLGRQWVISPQGIPHLSNETNPGWLGYVGDYTTQLYRDYNKPL